MMLVKSIFWIGGFVIGAGLSGIYSYHKGYEDGMDKAKEIYNK